MTMVMMLLLMLLLLLLYECYNVRYNWQVFFGRFSCNTLLIP